MANPGFLGLGVMGSNLLGERIISGNLADQAQLDSIRSRVSLGIDAAVEFAKNASYPGAERVREDAHG